MEPEEDIKSFDADPWAQQLDLQWEKYFEQRDPPTEDKVIQINVGDQAHSKLISISENLSPTEKVDLIFLIKEYTNVFAWSYEDRPGLDPRVAIHHLNIKPDAKPVKQQQRWFRPDIMEANETEVRNSLNVASFERNNTQIGLLILCSSLKRTKRFGFVLTFVILI